MTNRSSSHRSIARVTVEAATPLFIGSGTSGLLIDALIQKDQNNLPYIPGSSLTGVLRHSLLATGQWGDGDAGSKLADVFGYQKGDDGQGSRLKVSSGLFMTSLEKVSEGILEERDPELIKIMEDLPKRKHVRINERGVASDKGLFDNQILYQGARFVFELEFTGSETEIKEIWEPILSRLKHPSFRIGQGTRKGYGRLSVISVRERTFDLENPDSLEAYIALDPSFNKPLPASFTERTLDHVEASDNVISYVLELMPEDFFIFSEGHGDDDADNRPVSEYVLRYAKGVNKSPERIPATLIPASSIKGALRHRVCYHHNLRLGRFADSENARTAEHDEAVSFLFGNASGQEKENTSGSRGRVIMDDLLMEKGIDNNTVFNHVAINRFTGGALRGFLFSEKVSRLDDHPSIKLDVTLDMSGIMDGISEQEKEGFRSDLEAALKDICRGQLPLGGMTTKGHGIFTGRLFRNNLEIYEYDQGI